MSTNENVLSCDPANTRRPSVSGLEGVKLATEDLAGAVDQAPVKVNATGNKKLVQQAFHPSLFIARPKCAPSGKNPMSSNANSSDNEEAINQPADDNSTTSERDKYSGPPPWQRIPIARNPKRKKVSSTPSPEQVPVSNRFRDLPIDLTEDANADSKEKKIPKPPPIILYGIDEVSKLTELLETAVNRTQFSYKIINRNQLRVNCLEMDTYKQLIAVVRENGLIGHTFNRKDERLFRIVIRNLHPTTAFSAIREAIEETGNTVAGEIINAKYGPDKKSTSTFFVNIQAGPNNKACKDIRIIDRQMVVIEDPKKKKSIVQCHRCQQYGHSKNYCMRPYRCVKCAQQHKTSECPKTDRSQPALCALCEGSHPANYKGCEVYREILARRTIKQQKPVSRTFIEPIQKKQDEEKLSHQNMPNQQRRSYAETVKRNTEPSTLNSLELMLIKQTEKFDLILEQMSALMSLIVKLVDKLT
jgi:hypothetical protein